MSKVFLVLLLLAIASTSTTKSPTLAQIKKELLESAFTQQERSKPLQSKTTKRFPHRKLNIMEDVRDIINFLPSAIGVPYNDEADKDTSAIGNAVLGYGMYNNKAREESLRKLKEQFKRGMASRNLYIKSLDRRKEMLDSVIDAIESQMQLINSRSSNIVDELKQTAKDHFF